MIKLASTSQQIYVTLTPYEFAVLANKDAKNVQDGTFVETDWAMQLLEHGGDQTELITQVESNVNGVLESIKRIKAAQKTPKPNKE